MISTIVTTIHILVTLLLLSAAALILLANPRSAKNRAIVSILILNALASVAFGFSLNSFSFSQVKIWIVIEILTVYPAAPLAFYVALIILRPDVSKKLWISIPLLIIIVSPVFPILLDITNASQALPTGNILLNFDLLSETYTGGYAYVVEATTSAGVLALLIQLIGFYTMLIIYPSMVVAIRDRKENPENARSALILLVSAVFGSLVSTFLRDTLPATVAPMITNLILSGGFFWVGIRFNSDIRKEGQGWYSSIFQNYRMFTKLMGTTALLLLPAVLFISFATFSFFQTSLLNIADENLNATTEREAEFILNRLEDEIHNFEHLNDNQRILTQMDARANLYSGQSGSQIKQQIEARQIRWSSEDALLISTILDPVNNTVLKNFLNENENFLDALVVDNYGALITAAENPSNYDFSEAGWWQYVDEFKETYFGTITWNPDYSTYTTTIAVPLFNQSREFSGVLFADFTMAAILENLLQEQEYQVNFGFITPAGTVIPANGNPDSEFSIPFNILEQQGDESSWTTYEINQVSYLIGTAGLDAPKAAYAPKWTLIAYQPVNLALSPLFFARGATILTTLIIVAVSAYIIIGLAQSITQPLNKLSEAASASMTGNRTVKVDIDSSDELGTLANSFNEMTTELNAMVENLEETIDVRTRDLQRRAAQLEASTMVAKEAAGVRDLDRLLNHAVELISEKFGYYHTGIFLLDEQKRYAILQAANSEGGKRMLARAHKLPVGRVGVVGYCAGTGEPRIAQDVGADIVYYDNPDMPDTRSEMALPLIVRESIIGVLDVQSRESNAFKSEDIEVVQLLADQIALAIDNAQLFESSQNALEELQSLYSQAAATAWKQRLTGKEVIYQYDSTGITRKSAHSAPETSHRSGATLSRPITFRGQVIGELDFVREDQRMNWTEDEVQLIEEILEQTALALENARLVDQIRLRSDQIQLLQEITAMAASILDEKELLTNVAEKLQSSLLIHHCGIAIILEDTEQLELIASAGGDRSLAVTGERIILSEDNLTQLVLENSKVSVFHNYVDEPEFQTFVQHFSAKKGNTLILLPLVIRDDLVGYIFLEDTEENRQIDQEETNLYRQISAQLSAAIESARLFSAEQEGRLAAAALLEITQIASASLDMNRVLNQATNRSAQAIQAHRCTIFMLDEKEKIKPLISIYADGQQMPEPEWKLLQDKIHATYHEVPLRTLAANLRKPKIIHNPLTYTNIPMGWVEDFQIQKILMVPLISQNKVIGSMIYDQINPDHSFRQSQVEIAQTIAGQIATAIENSKLFEDAVLRAERERQVSEITSKIRATNDPEQIMETAIAELRLALAKSSEKINNNPPKFGEDPKPSGQKNGNDTGTRQ